VLEVGEFLATTERVAAGGSALDPMVVATSSRQSTTVPSLGSPSANAMYSNSSPKGSPTPPSPTGSWSANAQSKRTSATSSPNSTSPKVNRPPPRAGRPHLPQRHTTRLSRHSARVATASDTPTKTMTARGCQHLTGCAAPGQPLGFLATLEWAISRAHKTRASATGTRAGTARVRPRGNAPAQWVAARQSRTSPAVSACGSGGCRSRRP